MRVFIADDSNLVRERLREMISEVEGAEVVGEARDSDEALESIPRLRPDVVVLDLGMPGMPGENGIHLLERAKRMIPEIVVIMLTGLANDLFRKRCLGAGAAYFFDKSYEFERVCDVLENFEK